MTKTMNSKHGKAMTLTERKKYQRQREPAEMSATAPLKASEYALSGHIWAANESLNQFHTKEDQVSRYLEDDPLADASASVGALKDRFESKIVQATLTRTSNRRAFTIQNVQESKTMFEKEITRSTEARRSSTKNLDKVLDDESYKSEFER